MSTYSTIREAHAVAVGDTIKVAGRWRTVRAIGEGTAGDDLRLLAQNDLKAAILRDDWAEVGRVAKSILIGAEHLIQGSEGRIVLETGNASPHFLPSDTVVIRRNNA